MKIKVTRLKTLPIGCDGVTVYTIGCVRIFKLHTPIVWLNGRLQRWRRVWTARMSPSAEAIRMASQLLIAGNVVVRLFGTRISFSGFIPVKRP